jgi:hypothetical protein
MYALLLRRLSAYSLFIALEQSGYFSEQAKVVGRYFGGMNLFFPDPGQDVRNNSVGMSFTLPFGSIERGDPCIECGPNATDGFGIFHVRPYDSIGLSPTYNDRRNS